MNVPPGARTRLTSLARNASCRLMISGNTPVRNGIRPPPSSPTSAVLSGAPSSHTTGMPSGRSRAAAMGTLGGQASVATVWGALGDNAGVAPWQSLGRRPGAQPGEVPAGDRGAYRLRDQLVKRRHRTILCE